MFGGHFGAHFGSASYPNGSCAPTVCVSPACQLASDAGLQIRSFIRGPTLLQWDLRAVPEIRNWPAPIEVAIDYAHVGLDTDAPWTVVSDYGPKGGDFTLPGQRIFGEDFNSYYRLRLRNSVGDIFVTRPTSMYSSLSGSRNRRLYLEMIRLWNKRLTNHELQTGTLLKRKRWGDYCTTCRDRDGRQQIRSQCPECYDTGFTGGYYAGDTCFSIDPSRLATELKFDFGRGFSQSGPIQTIDCLNIPHVFPGDVWVDGTSDERWLFGSPMITKVKIGNVELFRTIPAARFDAPHIIYSFPID